MLGMLGPNISRVPFLDDGRILFVPTQSFGVLSFDVAECPIVVVCDCVLGVGVKTRNWDASNAFRNEGYMLSGYTNIVLNNFSVESNAESGPCISCFPVQLPARDPQPHDIRILFT